jgi:hypothetical protein
MEEGEERGLIEGQQARGGDYGREDRGEGNRVRERGGRKEEEGKR